MDLKVKKIENDTEEDRMLNELFVSPIRQGYVEIGDEKFVLPACFEDEWEKINKFEVRDDDVFLTGHPKTGTTWSVEMVELILNDFRVDYAKEKGQDRLFFLETSIIFDKKKMRTLFPDYGENLDRLMKAKSPRCIRTHLPWFLLPEQIRNGDKTPKIIHCLRNPKDTCVSYFHLDKRVNGYQGTFDEYCKLFLRGKMMYGSFFTTIKSYWEHRHKPNVEFVRYSDMKNDLEGTIRRTTDFLGKTATDEQINELLEYLSFDSMKQHIGKSMDLTFQMMTKAFGIPSIESNFIRVGKEGGYKSVMSKELIDKFDAATEEALLGLDLTLE